MLVNIYVPSTCLLSKYDRVRSNEVDLRDYNLRYHFLHPIKSEVPSYTTYTPYKNLTEEHSADHLENKTPNGIQVVLRNIRRPFLITTMIS